MHKTESTKNLAPGQTRSSRRKQAFLRISLLLFLAISIVVGISSYLKQENEMHRLKTEAVILERELSVAQAAAKEIDELRAMSGSREFIERMARDELGLVRPDELIFTN